MVKAENVSFSSSAKTKDGKEWNLKISSWNINGVRAWTEVLVQFILRFFVVILYIYLLHVFCFRKVDLIILSKNHQIFSV